MSLSQHLIMSLAMGQLFVLESSFIDFNLSRRAKVTSNQVNRHNPFFLRSPFHPAIPAAKLTRLAMDGRNPFFLRSPFHQKQGEKQLGRWGRRNPFFLRSPFHPGPQQGFWKMSLSQSLLFEVSIPSSELPPRLELSTLGRNPFFLRSPFHRERITAFVILSCVAIPSFWGLHSITEEKSFESVKGRRNPFFLRSPFHRWAMKKVYKVVWRRRNPFFLRSPFHRHLPTPKLDPILSVAIPSFWGLHSIGNG